MEKVKKFFGAAWNYIKTRSIGFYLLIPVVILSFVIPFVYQAEYGEQLNYWSTLAFALPFLACASFAMCFFKYTARYGSLVMFAFNLAGLLIFVDTVYYDVADKLFKAGNISIGGIFEFMGSNFLFVIFAYIINIVICFAASFFNQYRAEKKAAESHIKAQEVVS